MVGLPTSGGRRAPARSSSGGVFDDGRRVPIERMMLGNMRANGVRSPDVVTVCYLAFGAGIAPWLGG